MDGYSICVIYLKNILKFISECCLLHWVMFGQSHIGAGLLGIVK